MESQFELRIATYLNADAEKLIGRLQQEYVVRYGDIDHTAVDPAEFTPPLGVFLIAYADDEPVACGGWRTRDSSDPYLLDGDAEIKRMYVVPSARRQGLSRLILAELELAARAVGRRRLVLETGTKQAEAIALYTSSGYTPITPFGIHRDTGGARYYGKTLA